MVYLYIMHDPTDIQYIGSYDDALDAADHGHLLLTEGDGYWPRAGSIVISDRMNLETE